MARFQQTLASQASLRSMVARASGAVSGPDEPGVPWSELLALVEPFTRLATVASRLDLRLCSDLLSSTVVQLVGPGMEEAFYESPVLRRFAGVDLGVAAAPARDDPAFPPSA